MSANVLSWDSIGVVILVSLRAGFEIIGFAVFVWLLMDCFHYVSIL